MTKRLILMRHAKSDWIHDLEDHERPLNGQGRAAAAALRDWMGLNDYRPDQILCSTSERTRETLFNLDLDADTTFLRELYLADPPTLLAVIKKASGNSVLVLAHNPGIAWFANQILSQPPDHPRFEDFPSGATLVADFDINDWEDLPLSSGQCVDFVVPGDLT